MARRRKKRNGGTKFKISNTDETVTSLTRNNDTASPNSARNKRQEAREETTPSLTSPPSIALASTTCTKCQKKGGVVRVTTAKGELTCCFNCGKCCDAEAIKIIELKAEELCKVLKMDVEQHNSDDQDNKDYEMTETEWNKLKELGTDLGNLNLKERLETIETSIEKHGKTCTNKIWR